MDDDDKVRRNLVAASTALLAGWLLEVRQEDLAKRVWGEAITPQPFRLWLLVLVVLIYLFLRYYFSDERKEAYGQLLQEFYGVQHRIIVAGLQREYLRYKKTGQPPRHFKDRGEEKLKQLEEQFPKFKAFDPSFGQPGALQFTHAQREGRIPYMPGFDDNGRSVDGAVQFEVDRRLQVYSLLIAACRILVWSKGLTAVLIPVPLGLLAIGFALFRLISVA